MSTLNNLLALGTVETTRSYSYSKHLDPVERRRMNFIQNASRQLKEVEAGGDLSQNAWVAKRIEGGATKYKVSLRVGPKLVQFPSGGTHLVIDTKEKVIDFLKGVIKACKAKELDDLLAQTAGKGKMEEEPESLQGDAMPVANEPDTSDAEEPNTDEAPTSN